MFICGATGVGKSNFLQHFLINFKSNFNIPFLIIEFKGEYQFLQKIFDDLLIMKPGENFSINIFDSQGADPEIHAERIYDILASGQFLDENAEFSPQMEKVLVQILTKVCKMDKHHRNWNGFYKYCNIYSKKYRNKIPMLSQTLISITNRIRRFSLGPLKAIFDQKNEIRMKDLLRKNVIIDLSSIIRLGGEKSDALFFLNMILKYLWDKNLSQGSSNFIGAQHLTIIEDVQYFAPKELNNKSKLTSYLEDIALLQRGTGECLISIATRPNISEEILANSGVFAVFKTHMHKNVLGQLLNLEEEKYNFISLLDQGECIIRVNSIKEPFLLSVPHIERKNIKNSYIEENNKKFLSKLRE
jgi:DNA helicase HerA-like ATPase